MNYPIDRPPPVIELLFPRLLRAASEVDIEAYCRDEDHARRQQAIACIFVASFFIAAIENDENRNDLLDAVDSLVRGHVNGKRTGARALEEEPFPPNSIKH